MIDNFKRRVKDRLVSIMTQANGQAWKNHGRESDLAAKSTYATKVAQRSLFLQYQTLAKQGNVPSVDDTGYRIYSQFDEDGIFVFLFAVIGIHNNTFIDIGAGNGINSNCANLAINFGWFGLFIDGNPANVARGQEFYHTHPDTMLYPPPRLSRSW